MADHDSVVDAEKEVYVKKLKRVFDSGRELVLLANSALLWERKYDPWILFGVTTGVFLNLARLDLSLMTALSILLLLLTFLDVCLPLVCSFLWKQDNWTSDKERKLEDICRKLATSYVSCKHFWNSALQMRAKKPHMYYPVAIVILASLAWLGSSVNNLFLTYVVALGLTLLPGLTHIGLVDKCYEALQTQTSHILHSLSASPKKNQ